MLNFRQLLSSMRKKHQGAVCCFKGIWIHKIPWFSWQHRAGGFCLLIGNVSSMLNHRLEWWVGRKLQSSVFMPLPWCRQDGAQYPESRNRCLGAGKAGGHVPLLAEILRKDPLLPRSGWGWDAPEIRALGSKTKTGEIRWNYLELWRLF